MIQIKGLSIQYEDTASPAVSDIDLTIREGESVLFLGPSGCGKSTLAMWCAGLIPTAMEATVQGEWSRDPGLEQPGAIGYVFQDPDAQFCMLTVGDEIAFGLENQRIHTDEMEGTIRESLASVQLPAVGDAIHVPHNRFSGGMKQKLAIASARAMNAKLLILDEPTANLDPLATHLLFQQIATLHQQRQSMIIIEHKFLGLLPYVDRVVVFDRTGRIHRTGDALPTIRDLWPWLQEEGIVPLWKAPPTDLDGSEFPWLLPAAVVSNQMNDDRASRLVHVDASDHAPAVQLHEVTVGYAKLAVWSNLTLSVPYHSMTAIVGPNGSGKTTLLQTMAGLLKPKAGGIQYEYASMIGRTGPSRRDSAVAYCFQNPEFQFVFERVKDELCNEVVQGATPEPVIQLLKQFGLDGLEERSPYALSQGQKRRLSVAAMLKSDHALYCLDEPTFGQDSHTEQAIMDELARLHQNGKTIVWTTHDMDLVRHYATHVIVVVAGEVLYQGPPKHLWERPDILLKAHLMPTETVEEDVQVVDSSPELSGQPKRESPLRRLNPAWYLVSVFASVIVTLFVHHLTQAVVVFLVPVLIMLVLGRVGPWSIVKRYAVFLLFYAFYLFTYMAYSKVPPGSQHVVHFLWMHADWYGFRGGLVLALRMLGAVGLGMLFLTNMELAGFASALSQSMRMPPRFSYGLMAGAHFMPLFREEWRKLRQARRLRGREGAFWVRPALYSIPILSQAIRMSERVAIAMEARGFVGAAARQWNGRTYYRILHVTHWDVVYDVGVPLVLLILVLGIH